MKQVQKRKRPEEHPAVVAARRNKKLVADVRAAIASLVAGEPDIPGHIVTEEARKRRERLQP